MRPPSLLIADDGPSLARKLLIIKLYYRRRISFLLELLCPTILFQLILIPYSTASEAEATLKEEIDNVELWCKHLNLCLNTEKTQIMAVRKKFSESLSPYLYGLTLQSELTHLGVIFDDKLNWNSHVLKIAKKAAQRIYPLKQLKNLSSIGHQQLIQVYNIYILSILEYNSPLFVGMTKRNTTILERVRKRCHRIICSSDCKEECLPPLTERRVQRAMRVFQSALQESHILHHLAPQFLKYSSALSIPLCHTQRRSLSFFPFCTRKYNEL